KTELHAEIKLHPSAPWGYRNRTRLRVQTAPEFALGYYRFGSHQFLAARECPISSPAINRVMARLLELEGCACPEAVEEIELFADAADERLLAWTFCARESDRQALLSWAEAVRREVPSITGITFFPARRKPEDDEPPDIKPLARSG